MKQRDVDVEGEGDSDSRYPCHKCGRVYRWKHTRDNHAKNECGQDPRFQCPLCPHRSKRAPNLRIHIYLKHNKRI
ncbi:longitudinals lacking protein, isoforms A/B/D/L-like isoform X2 [Nilaparvata lugens]|uniref:longitudinals lacking protein, isoforms A/B/D/L-like isoform X2 n=1 Tax=Nilaparvata lugens TaxID=108931 RepID=UPI000B989DE4|nr:longitudinals lacking protein, isoforms A/B/D/L-like isoform X2 [Nilaparvata lugens]